MKISLKGRPLTKKTLRDAFNRIAKQRIRPDTPVILPFHVFEEMYWVEVFEDTLKGTGFMFERATEEGVV